MVVLDETVENTLIDGDHSNRAESLKKLSALEISMKIKVQWVPRVRLGHILRPRTIHTSTSCQKLALYI